MVQIRFNVDDILPKLNMVASVVNPKSPLPILGDVLMETYDDGNGEFGVVFTASDSESWLSCKAPLVEGVSDVSIGFDIKKLKQALSNLPGKEIVMEIDEQVKTAKFSHKKGYFSLPYDDGKDFPEPSVEQEDEISIIMDASILVDAMSVTSYATANETLRPILNGIHIDFTKDYMIAVATDGRKLSRYQNDSVKIDAEDGVVKGFTFPAKPSQLLPSVLTIAEGDVKVTFGNNMVIINDRTFRFVTRLLTFKYPTYERVIPQSSDVVFEVNRNELIDALQRVIPLGNDASQYVAFIIESYKLTLSTENVEFSTNAKEEVDCTFIGDGFTIGFKGSYLMQTLKAFECDTLKVMMQDNTRCGLFVPTKEEEGLHQLGLLVPMVL